MPPMAAVMPAPLQQPWSANQEASECGLLAKPGDQATERPGQVADQTSEPNLAVDCDQIEVGGLESGLGVVPRPAPTAQASNGSGGGGDPCPAALEQQDEVQGLANQKRELIGMRFVPIDLVLEQVRSRGVQGFLILTMVFVMTSSLILDDRSSLRCSAVTDDLDRRAPTTPDAQEVEWHGFLDGKYFSFMVLLCMGLLNSRYFLRGSGAVGVRVAQAIVLLCAVFLVWRSTQDLTTCDSYARSGAELCGGPGRGPVARLLVEIFGDELGQQAQSKWLLFGLVASQICKSEVATDAIVARCAQVAGADWCDPDALASTCEQVVDCYYAYDSRLPTAARAGTKTALLWLLMLATLWDLTRNFLPARIAHLKDLARSCRCLARRVPLTLFAAVLLDANWCTTQASRFSPAFWDLMIPKEPWRTILVWLAPCFLATQFLVCLGAAVYNFRQYLHHTQLLASIPWAALCESGNANNQSNEGNNSSEAGPSATLTLEQETRLREAGLDAERLAKNGNMYSPYYFGVVWASLLLGSFLLALVPVAVVAAVVVMVVVPGSRPLLWSSFFGKLYVSLGLYILADTTLRSTQALFWGSKDGFPRRPASLALHDAIYSLMFLYTSPFLALSRLMKSLFISIVGMLVVTRPGTHEGLVGDTCHEYYMSILRVERFRLEVEKWGSRNEKLTCKSHCADLCGYTAKLFLIWSIAVSLYCLLAYLCGVKLVDAFDAAASGLGAR